VGTACNFSCAHCCSAYEGDRRLSGDEIASIVNTINTRRIYSLYFVGGETTLYIPEINNILSGVNRIDSTKVHIITNGYFAINSKAAEQVLSSFLTLTSLSLSYDKYHKKFLPLSSVKMLYNACVKKKIKFNVSVAISSPLDLSLLNHLTKIGNFPINIQGVMSAGRAKDNITLEYPCLDKDVLSRGCPINKKLFYLCGRGYSTCCGSLILNRNATEAFVKPKCDDYLASNFYKIISKYSFGELLDKYNIPKNNLHPKYSVNCNLCEYIFRNAQVIRDL